MTHSLLITPENYPSTFDLQDECHLWILDAAQISQTIIEQHKFILSDSELARAQAMKVRQLEFFAIREFVRLCLSRYSNQPAQHLMLEANTKGKPFLTNSTTPIRFNLSHSNTMAIIAIDAHHDVGVDIESVLRHKAHRDIAARYFHPQEVATLATLNDADHDHYFFRLWTLKEAFLKATGAGISAGLEKIAFHLDENIIHPTMSEELKTDAAEWQFQQTFISDEFCVALARHSSQPINIRWFDGAQLFV